MNKKMFYALCAVFVLGTVIFATIFFAQQKKYAAAVNQLNTANAATSTPIPPTITPTPSCTDKGWSEIQNYMNSYKAIEIPTVGESVLAHITALNEIVNKIEGIEIDSCTETARQLIVEGLKSKTLGYQYISMGTPVNAGPGDAMLAYAKDMKAAQDELDKLDIGVTLDF